MKFTNEQIAMLRDALGYVEAQIITSEIPVFDGIEEDVDSQREAVSELLDIVIKELDTIRTRRSLTAIADEIYSNISSINESNLAEGIAAVLKNILDTTVDTIDTVLDMRAVYSILHNDENDELNIQEAVELTDIERVLNRTLNAEQLEHVREDWKGFANDPYKFKDSVVVNMIRTDLKNR